MAFIIKSRLHHERSAEIPGHYELLLGKEILPNYTQLTGHGDSFRPWKETCQVLGLPSLRECFDFNPVQVDGKHSQLGQVLAGMHSWGELLVGHTN